MMSAESIAKALGGKKVGSGWIACCPAHEDREPSLSIGYGSGKVLVHCHAGCNQRDVIAVLTERRLWTNGKCLPHRKFHRQTRVSLEPGPNESSRTAAAISIWRSADSSVGSPVESYLVSRGLTLSVPRPLRSHRGLKHPSGEIWPCMVALVTRGANGSPIAIHRTFLARDGSGKAPINPAKMMLGPCHGGAVRLGEPDDILMVGEGIETCLSAMQANDIPAWAALSTSGLRALSLPLSVREVIVLADGDDRGEAAARDCGLRWQREGRCVRIARPPRGQDFNDMLTGSASRKGEDRP